MKRASRLNSLEQQLVGTLREADESLNALGHHHDGKLRSRLRASIRMAEWIAATRAKED